MKCPMWSYLWNWNRNGRAKRHLPGILLTKQTWFEHQWKRTPTQTSGNLSSSWVAKSGHWRLEHSISNAWHIPLWMLVEFIMCTMIGYNLYKNTACAAHISGSVSLIAHLIFICQPSCELDSLANPVRAFLSFYSVIFECVPGWSTHTWFSCASKHACHTLKSPGRWLFWFWTW